MYIYQKVKKIFRNIGITIDRYPTGDLRRRLKLINYFNIEVIYDVGANKGQYALLMRKLGYKGQLLSYEPLSGPYNIIEQKSMKDPLWETFQLGIGDKNEKKTINVSENLVSSSFQNMLPIHIKEDYTSRYVDSEEVEVKTFDSIFQNNKKKALLKIDTQGYELNVLKGASNSLNSLTAIQLEMCLSQTYENEPDYLTIINLLKEKGFKLFSLEPGYSKKDSGQLYQVDGIFFRDELDQE